MRSVVAVYFVVAAAQCSTIHYRAWCTGVDCLHNMAGLFSQCSISKTKLLKVLKMLE